MKKNFRLWVASAVGITAAFAFSSCAYDPYYSSVGGSYGSGYGYSSGYGQGYGYGGSNFSTSLFVTTGDPRWGYDPGCHSYYDYRSRRYYDPYLYGYYPVGYRPVVVYGAPHPYGWRPGRSYCPPPRTIRNVTVVNYQNRESAYRNSDYSWAKKVYSQPSTHHRSQSQEPNRSSYGSPGTYDRNSSPAPSTRTSPYRQTSPYGSTNPPSRDSYKSRQALESVTAPDSSQTQRENQKTRQKLSDDRSSQHSDRAPKTPSRQSDFGQQNSRIQRESQQPSGPSSHSRSRSESRPTPPANKRDEDDSSKSKPGERRGIRSLGEG